jgi:Protein of unknown function (DUF3108)
MITQFLAKIRQFRTGLASFALLLAISEPVRAADAPRPIMITYSVSIAHIPIGAAKFSASFRGSTYHLHLAAEFSGLVRLFFAPDLAADAEGTVASGKMAPQHYQLTVNHPDDPQTVDMHLQNGTVAQAVLDPPLPYRDDRVPVLPEHKRGVVDPMSGFLMPITASSPLTSNSCSRTLPVFDGAGRFDISLIPDRDGTYSTDGYAGPIITCLVRYTPISGHRAKKTNVTYMENNRDIVVSLAQVPGRPFLLPLKISVATLIGDLRLEAEKVDGMTPYDVKNTKSETSPSEEAPAQ